MFDELFDNFFVLRGLRALVLALLMLVTPLILAPSLLEFVIAETWPARLAAAAVGMGWLGLCLSWLSLYESLRRPAILTAGLLFCLAFLCCGIVYQFRPTGSPPMANFRSVYGDEAHFNPLSLSNLVPEIDQLKLGRVVFGALDPVLSKSGSARIRDLILKIYRELDQDATFRESGSALGFCYEDIFCRKRTTLHYYEYIPRQWKRERYPVMIFLHGSMGNFKGYLWVLKKFSDATGIAIIAPTYGVGNWDRDKNSSVIRAVLDQQRSRPDLDFSRPYLAGISNGGTGMTRAVANVEVNWAGLVFLSPVVEDEIVSSPEFKRHSKNLKVLMIHGEKDDRIDVSFIRASSKDLKQQGADVEEHYFPGEDHFLVFSEPDEVVKKMITWLVPPKS